MHDLDYMEIDADLDIEDDEFADADYYEDEPTTRRLTDAQLNELAADLLAVSDDEDMEQFLGKLVGSVAKGAGKFLRSGAGKALTGGLKSVAKAALPAVGGAIGSLAFPGVGTAIGSQLGSAVGSLFEAEVEGLSPEDQEFEIARRVVKLGEVATREAVKNPSSPAAAKAAVKKAVKKVAPSASELVAQGASEDDLDELAANLVDSTSDEEIGGYLNDFVRRVASSPAAQRVWNIAKPALIDSAKAGLSNLHGQAQSWLDAQELATGDPYEDTRRLVSIVNEAASIGDGMSKQIPPKKAAVVALRKAAKAAKQDSELGGFPMRGYGGARGAYGGRSGQRYGQGHQRQYRQGYAGQRSRAMGGRSGRWVRQGRNIIIIGA